MNTKVNRAIQCEDRRTNTKLNRCKAKEIQSNGACAFRDQSFISGMGMRKAPTSRPQRTEEKDQESFISEIGMRKAPILRTQRAEQKDKEIKEQYG